ncbi:Uncharacterized protein APZ42_017682 [Daphnia magna]|uniref:Uncharacterized protein n=1 Tax=Daphnia magna TaxID=35525 RepID=A0A164ZZE3_9CRUS|nr:Uncharacterized protein APZ42_017682 [Daphnia magna]
MRHDILECLDFSGFLSPELTESKTTSLTLKPQYFFANFRRNLFYSKACLAVGVLSRLLLAKHQITQTGRINKK